METAQNYTLIDTDCIPQRDNEIPEWFEDAACEADWIDNFSINDADSQSVSCSLVGGSNHSMDILDELYEKNKVLEKEWKNSEKKFQNLLLDHQNISIQLSNEKNKSNKYRKKLQYIQDNYDIFNRLKQAYLNVKYNEAAGRSMVKIEEKSCQTTQDVPEEEDLDLERFFSCKDEESALITVKRSDLSQCKMTVQKLKNVIDKHIGPWSTDGEAEKKYESDIAHLHNNIALLNDTVSERNSELEAYKAIGLEKIYTMQKENVILKKIIVKIMKRFSEMEKIYKPLKRPPILNENEKIMVKELIDIMTSKQGSSKSTTEETNSTTTSDLTPRTALDNSLTTTNESSSYPVEAGCGEDGTFTLKIPFLKLRPANDFNQEAEKPLSPKKLPAQEQELVVNYSDHTISETLSTRTSTL